MQLLSSIKDIFNRKILRRSQDRWNYQYRQGKWNTLAGIGELGRFSVIVGYAQFLKSNGKILEIGAGEGYLQQRFDKNCYSLYYATDVSDVAVANGKKYEDTKTKYLVADMNTYIPDTDFDCIVFNEVIYYASSVDFILDRFAPFLRPNGIFILSINGDDKNKKWHQMVETSNYPKIDQTTVYCTSNWFCITVLGKS